MSYILEALRKSERERQLGQAPSLPSLVVDQPPQRRRWLLWALLLLLGFNGGAWFYFSFRGGDRVQTVNAEQSPPPVAAAKPMEVKPVPGDAAAEKVVPAANVNVPQQEPAKTEIATQPSQNESIKEAIREAVKEAVKEAAVVAPEKALSASKPDAGKQALASAVQVPTETDDEQQGKNTGDRLREERIQRMKVELAAVAEPSSPPVMQQKPADIPKAAADNDLIPILSAMPAAFQQRIPPLTINVLAHSSVPKERFAVINMVKYNNGDPIPGGARLLEIRPDSVVLELDGSKFRIPQR